jgi:alpha-L-fucosidase
MHGQVRELCTNYGKIDILWFDFSYWHLKGEIWKATELIKMVRSLQPHIIINNRLGGDIHSRNPEIYAGDFTSPEQNIPHEGLSDEEGNPLAWEACITLNNNWGYCAVDKNYKKAEFIIRTLVNCISKNGNLMVNVGPDAKGEIPEAAADILTEVGRWLHRNKDSIYGCGASDFEKPEWGHFTQKGNKLYMHILDTVLGHINLKGIKGKIKKARLLSDRSEVIITDFWNADNGVEKLDNPDDIFINFGYPVVNTYPLPDPRDTVVELEMI